MTGRVAVLGAGNGGQALSAHLAMMGNQVSLYEHPDFAPNLAKIKEKGGIELTGTVEGFGRLASVSSDMEEALQGTEVLYMVVPSFGQMPMIREAMPFIEEGMKIILIPGNFGSLEIASFLRNEGFVKGITLAETDTLPYACRMIEPGRVHIWGIKKGISIASFPGKDTEKLVNTIREVFPIPLRPGDNVLEIAFSNLNMIVHCSAVLLNAGRIESIGGDFRFYTDGVTPSVGKLQEILDAERVKVGRSLGLDLVDAVHWIKASYPVEGDSIYELLAKNPVYAGHGSDAPKMVKHRYVTEDVPNLLVPVVSFARAAGVETPVMTSLITLLSAITDGSYMDSGRNLERLGLKGMGVEKIREYLGSGSLS